MRDGQRKRDGKAEGRSRPPVARLQRRLFHLAAGSTFPIMLLFLPKTPVLAAAAIMLFGSLAVEILRLRRPTLNAWVMSRLSLLTKEREWSTLLGSTYLLLSTVVVVGALSRPIATLALFYLSVGDPLAAMVGERLGSASPGKKSLQGSIAFLGGCLAIGGLLLTTALETAVPVMLIGAAAATLIERLPSPVDDNLTVPLGSGALMALAALFLA